MYAFFVRVKLQSQSMVQNLDPNLALKKKLEHRAQENHEHHWFGRAWPAQCGWQEVARPARAAGPKESIFEILAGLTKALSKEMWSPIWLT